MGTRTSYPPGCFSWIELQTTDIEAAAAFYKLVFGWEHRDSHDYGLFSLPGGDVAGGFSHPRLADAGLGGPHWNTHITVADVDASAARVTDLGGTILVGPVDAHTAGRKAVVTDPSGAVFSLWQPGERFGAEYVNEPGAWSWSELMSRDLSGAIEFYEALFGWSFEAAELDIAEADNPYRVISLDGRQIGGSMTMPDEVPPEVPSNWQPYINVADIDAVLGSIGPAGGGVLTDVMEIPTVGRFASVHDPQGASFAVIQAEAWED